jgi:general secretion pathway protein D
VTRRPRFLAPILVTLLALAGCARNTPPALAPLPPAGPNAQAAPRVNGSVGAPDQTPPVQVALGTSSGGAAKTGVTEQAGGDVSLDFADTDIREVVAQILGTALRKNFTIDPAVKGTATFHTATPLPRGELLRTLQVLLGQNGAAMVEANGIYRIVPVAESATAGIAGSDTAAGDVVLPLRYTSAEALAKLLTPFAGTTAKIAAEPGGNALLISGDPATRNALVSLARGFDVDALAGQSYALLPVTGGDPKDFASALQDTFKSQNNGALAGLIRVVPLERIGSVLLIASTPRYIEEARRVFALVEKARRFNERSWHVYYLQNSHSDDVAYLLQQAFTPHNVTAQPTSAGQASRGGTSQLGGGGFGQSGGGIGAGGATGGGLGGGGLGGGGLGGGGLGGGGLGQSLGGGGAGLGGAGTGTAAGGPAQSAPVNTAAANPLLGGLDTSGGGGGGAEGNDLNAMRIIPNAQNNAVLVYATPQEAGSVEAMLRKVDILPLQVRIDAVIAEVTLNDQLQYGTQFFFRSGPVSQTLSAAASGATTPTFPGYGFAISGSGIKATLSALQSITQVNVLSSPELLVVDNETAHLMVGALVPYLSQTSQSTISSNAPVVNSVQYQQTGVIMDVTPRVNSGGLVTLDISQEVSDVSDTVTTNGLNSPTFNERRVVSRVVVQDGQTLGLAGLIQDSSTKQNGGIPWLKDVPILGFLASQQSNTRDRTELLVLITPHVVRDQRDARALTEDLREALPNAAAVPQQLLRLPPSGSSDPTQPLRQKLRLEP